MSRSLYQKEHPSLNVNPTNYTSLSSYNSAGTARVARLVPVSRLAAPAAVTQAQPRAVTFIPVLGGTGYNSLSGPAMPGAAGAVGYSTLRAAYG